MRVEILMIAFTFILFLCLSRPDQYFLGAAAAFAFAAFWKHIGIGKTSLFTTDEVTDKTDQDIPGDLDSSSDIDEILSRKSLVTNGDDLLVSQMQHVGGQAQDAILNRTRFSSDNFRGVFQEELDAGEQRDWWEDDSLSRGTVKDGEHWE